MLPLPGDSFDLKRICRSLDRKLDRIEEVAEEYSRRIASFFPESGLDVFIVFNGGLYSEPSAYILYWVLETLLSDINIAIGHVDDFIYHVASYRDEYSLLVFFSEPGGENSVYRLLNVTRATGRKAVVVSTPLPLYFKQWLNTSSVLYFEVDDYCPFLFLLVSFYTGLNYVAMKTSNLRVERLLKEKSISSVFNDIIELYFSEIRRLFVMDGRSISIVYTPTMRSPAVLFNSLIRDTNCSRLFHLSDYIQYVRLNNKCIGRNLVLFATTVEEDLVRELENIVKMRCKGTEIVKLVVKTDPLTAPIYASVALLGGLERL